MKKMKLCGIALAVLAVVALAQPVQAACGAPFLITSINQGAGYYSYVYNPTVTDDGYMGSTVTAQITGFFWGVGFGDPALGVGADNGSYPALNWLYIYPNYPATILTTWAADPGIDTCIDVMGPLGQRCQFTLLQDVDTATGAGLFALGSAPDDPASGDFFLDNDGVPAALVALAKPTITSSASLPAGCRDGGACTGVAVGVIGPTLIDLAPGLYLDGCQGDPNDAVSGWELYYQVLPRGSAPPSDFAMSAWTDAGLGGNDLGGLPLEAVPIDCGGVDSDVYVAYALLLDSGFKTPILSASSTRIECGPLVAEPDNIRVRPEGRQAPRTRQR